VKSFTIDVGLTTTFQGGKMMKKVFTRIAAIMILAALILPACSTPATPPPAPTSTPQPTATDTVVPTNTSTPTKTPLPTATPNLAATQKYEGYNQEIQNYFDAGYLDTTSGSIKEIDDFSNDWAQLGWYQWMPLGEEASDFVLSGHFRWMSAYKNADESGCGLVFAIQPDSSHYAVFLDRAKIIFLDADSSYGSYSLSVGKTRGSGRVKFGNPGEADFTLIVKDHSAYVLVDGELIGEYSLAQSRVLNGEVGLSTLSGTNKDYGTRCEMTDLHMFIPE
jgi:hypothetical protein